MSARQLYIRADGNNVLTTDQLRDKIPAIFAGEKHYRRSERFVEISTVDALERLVREGFNIVSAQQAFPKDVSRFGKCKHAVRLRHPGIGGGTAVVGNVAYFEVLMQNAFDGTCAFIFSAALYRWWCANGAVVADDLVEAVRVSHGGSRDKTLERVVSGVTHVVEQAPKVVEAVNNWAHLELTQGEQDEFAERAHKIRFENPATPVTPRQLLHPRRPQDIGNDLWTVFNVVQENCIKGGLEAPQVNRRTGSTIRRLTREIFGIDQNTQVNKALWAEAGKIAKLKLGV